MSSLFTQALGVDFGTANLSISDGQRGTLLREPSVAAISAISGELLAVGEAASALIRQTPGEVMAMYPVNSGCILDYQVARRMLKFFLRRMRKNRHMAYGTKVVMCARPGVGGSEKMAMEEAARYAGAKEVSLIEEPIAVGIGAGLNVFEPRGRMIIELGAGEGCASVVSLGGVVESQPIPTGGSYMNECISDYLLSAYGVHIGDTAAESIKLSYSAHEGEMSALGRGEKSGLPEEIHFRPSEIEQALMPVREKILECVIHLFQKTPPELVADISEEGILLSGGASLMPGLADFIGQSTGVPTRLAEHPFSAPCQGAGMAAQMGNC